MQLDAKTELVLNDERMIKTFEKLPKVFTSKQFCKIAKKYGLEQSLIDQGWVRIFVGHHCDRIGKFTARKKDENDLFSAQDSEAQIELKEKQAIEFLKERGFKIMRVKFEEV